MYVFTQSEGTWNQHSKLVAGDGDEGDSFGNAISTSTDGTRILIGAPGDEDPTGDSGTGSVYEFGLSDDSREQQTKIGNYRQQGLFGGAVALSGDGTTAIVGAPKADGAADYGGGAGYVLSRSDGTWAQEVKITPDDGINGDYFGNSIGVSTDGTTGLVGTRDSHEAYVFTFSKRSWNQQANLDSAEDIGISHFGSAVSLSDDGNTALIGAPDDNTPNGDQSGSAFLYSRSDGTWTEIAELMPTNGNGEDRFGYSVALSGDGSTALVGASRKEGADGGFAAGAAYAFDVPK